MLMEKPHVPRGTCGFFNAGRSENSLKKILEKICLQNPEI